MNNFLRSPNGQPMVSQQAAAEMMAQQQFQHLYLGLVGALASRTDIPIEDSDDMEVLCRKAWQVAAEAMKKLGVNIV